MHGWKTVSLGDVCVIEKTKYKDGELPYVGMEDIVSGTGKFVGSREPKKVGSSTFRFTPEHLLYGRLRPYLNKVLLPDFEGHCSSEIFPFLPKVGLDKSFLFYWITSERVVKEINRTCTGTRMPRANINEVLKLDIPFPPISEQKRIVAILDEAFAGIDTAIANTEKNLANARELFESYLNSVFDQRGEGWTDDAVGNIAEHRLGKMLDKNKNKGEFKTYLRNLNVQWFVIQTDDVLEMRFEEDEYEKYLVLKGDLLICEGGYPGRAAIWEKDYPIFYQKALHRVRCKEPRYNRWLLYYLFISDTNGSLKKCFTGTGIQHFTGQSLKKLVVPIPPSSQIDGLLERFDLLHEQAQQLESIYQQKLNSLKELKQSLLQKAFSGELTAKADKLIDEAAA